MNDMIFDDYQNKVSDCSKKYNNLLDILTKYNESTAKINTSVVNSINKCGCIKLQNIKNNKYSSNNKVCESCREIIENEIGNNLFYLTSLCNIIGINLYDTIIQEYKRLNILGEYNLQ